MENPEGVLNLLDEFAKLKSKEIPNDLEEYLLYVAASGDPVYQWSLIKSLYRQKLINVITEFYEMCPMMDIPRCPNVDPFNYETMKNSLLKRLDSFSSAPFTIQRISELLTTPRKQYNRVDKFMRAIEKNIWVVSTREPGPRESTNPQETSTNLVNGVTPRVCVTVKHPKRVKSIEERIKSGHPQLIDDDEDDDEDEEEEEEEEEIEDFEQIEEENNTEILQNNEPEDSSLQCTSVKDLIEKYENGTIFSSTEEKSDFEEKSVHIEETGMETETTDTTLTPPTSSLSPPKETEKGISDKEAIPDTIVSEPKEEATEPVVAADSSSDLPVQESETTGTVEAEMSILDSTSNVSVEESEQIVESSTPSSTDVAFSENENGNGNEIENENENENENDAASIMINTPTETSESDNLPSTPTPTPIPTPDEKIQVEPESSSDSVSVDEFLSKEIDPVNKTDENEQMN